MHINGGLVCDAWVFRLLAHHDAGRFLSALVLNSENKIFFKGEVIARASDEAGCMYIVESGKVCAMLLSDLKELVDYRDKRDFQNRVTLPASRRGRCPRRKPQGGAVAKGKGRGTGDAVTGGLVRGAGAAGRQELGRGLRGRGASPARHCSLPHTRRHSACLPTSPRHLRDGGGREGRRSSSRRRTASWS